MADAFALVGFMNGDQEILVRVRAGERPARVRRHFRRAVKDSEAISAIGTIRHGCGRDNNDPDGSLEHFQERRIVVKIPPDPPSGGGDATD